MVGEVVSGVKCRHERKWTLGRVPLSFVIDVVKDQTIQTQRTKPSDRRVGDLLGAFATRLKARRGESKEQELALTAVDTADQIHRRGRYWGGRGATPTATRPAREDQNGGGRYEKIRPRTCRTGGQVASWSRWN